MAEKPKTLSRSYAFERKVYTPHSTDVPQALLDRDAAWVAAKAARADEGDETEGAEAPATRSRPRTKKAKRK